MRRILSLLLCAIFALPFTLPASAKPPVKATQTRPAFAALTRAIDQSIDKNIKQGRIAGTVILVSYDGQLVYHRAAGFADPEKKALMKEDAIFRLASVSKAFTSMAAGALIEQGKLNPDDPVSKWLPDFRPKTADGKTPVITVRHLMTHTAGLDYRFFQPKDGPYHKANVSDGLERSDITLDENIRRIASAPLLFEPGTAWHYSLAIDVLGGVVAKANGTSFPQAMADLVTKPLGMKDTVFYVAEKDRERMAVPYYLDKGRLVRMHDRDAYVPMGEGAIHFSPDRAFDTKSWPSGGAGLSGTGADLMILLETIRKGGAPIIKNDIMKQMCANQTGKLAVMPGTTYGLGWAVLTDPAAAKSPQSAGTLFWSGVYGHNWFTDPARKLSVVVLTTTTLDSLESRGLATDVRDAVYANLPK
ncbi:beta-lactamase family protein [Oxalobacter sp. OttesenSCG-928-P03]|nr:beta-lactamase family protein [Oxalobacter sp. OttesenSCG-928-P03]